MTTTTDQIKAKKEHIDTISVTDHPFKPQHEELDRFGALLVRSPAQVALVKKLDRWMMDLNLKDTQYNTCASIFFVGYLVGQVPSNLLLTRIKPSKGYKSMLACRFVLGITEAPFYPGGVFLISQFYTRKESATRPSVFYTGNLLTSSFSGLISAGVFAGMEGKHGLAGWRWLFIIQGSVTVGVAVLAFFMLPNAPLETRWLTQEECELAHSRISVWKGLAEACLDYRTWVFALLQNSHLSANGFKNFLPTVVKTLGFNRTITLVLTCPPYLLSAFISIAVAWSSGRYNERTWHITASKAVVIIGFIIGTVTLNVGARYFAMVLFVAVVAIVNTLGNLSFVYTPYLWPDSSAPRFSMAMWASAGFSAGVILCAWALRFILMRDNRKIRAQDNEAINFYVY
ncbi:major facilitator superfamily transporter [Lizonia empirigonia]|nr:major facilitator superfamily transporter [Lizonia empirigonia]